MVTFRIDPDSDRDGPPLLAGDAGQEVELLGRLDVQVTEPGPHRCAQLGRRLADPAEHHARGLEPGGEHPGQLAARDDVGAGAEVAENAEDGEGAVGLDRETDAVGNAGKGLVQDTVPLADGAGVVDVRRSAHLGRDLGERDVAQPETPAGAREARVGEQARHGAGQYALAHTASATLGRPHHMQVVGATGERNSSSGSTRIVAFVCSLISASHSGRPQNPA